MVLMRIFKLSRKAQPMASEVDQPSWPAHLRDDAPYQRCGRCRRRTYATSEFNTECRMTQPDGFPCGGRFEGEIRRD